MWLVATRTAHKMLARICRGGKHLALVDLVEATVLLVKDVDSC
jgi:hypothetical protein